MKGAVGDRVEQLAGQNHHRRLGGIQDAPAHRRHCKRYGQYLLEREAGEQFSRVDHHYHFRCGCQGPADADEASPMAQLGQVDGEKTIVSPVTYQHEEGAQEKYHRVTGKQPDGIVGMCRPPRADSWHGRGSHGLSGRKNQHQGNDDTHVISVDHLSQNDHHGDECDRPPCSGTAVAVFGLAQHIHGKGFEKRDDRGVKGTVDDGDNQHESKVGGKEEKRPQGRADNAAQDVNGATDVFSVRQDAP